MTLKIQPESKTSTKTPSDWGDFDPIEYVTRNYGKILPEDRIIIQTVITSFKNLSLRRAKLVADVGAGPNFYPAMLLASLIEEDAQIDLIEFSKPNQTFMKVLLDSPNGMYRNRNKLGKIQSMNTREPWQKFDKLIAELGGQDKFEQTFARARAAAKSIQGDIYSLPEATYDYVSSYFVAESISYDKPRCIQAINSLVGSVRPGGGFMIALMVGSKGWPAGEATHFPAVDLSLEQIKDLFSNIPGLANVHVALAEDKHEKARKGYHGMAIVLGERTT